jgi:hypothetical protein
MIPHSAIQLNLGLIFGFFRSLLVSLYSTFVFSNIKKLTIGGQFF